MTRFRCRKNRVHSRQHNIRTVASAAEGEVFVCAVVAVMHSPSFVWDSGFLVYIATRFLSLVGN